MPYRVEVKFYNFECDMCKRQQMADSRASSSPLPKSWRQVNTLCNNGIQILCPKCLKVWEAGREAAQYHYNKLKENKYVKD